MYSGSILEALAYIFIVLLFFGLPLAALIYGAVIAARKGIRPPASQELEKRLPPETAKEFSVDDARLSKIIEDEKRASTKRGQDKIG